MLMQELPMMQVTKSVILIMMQTNLVKKSSNWCFIRIFELFLENFKYAID